MCCHLQRIARTHEKKNATYRPSLYPSRNYYIYFIVVCYLSEHLYFNKYVIFTLQGTILHTASTASLIISAVLRTKNILTLILLTWGIW